MVSWLLTSAAAERINKALIVLDGVAIAACIALVAIAWTTASPVPLAGYGLALAGPLLIFGQLWAIAVVNARMRSANRNAGGRRIWPSAQITQWVFFGLLPRRLRWAINAAAAMAWLSGFAAFPALLQGNPAANRPGCRYPLESHGAVTCVTQTRYLDAGAGGDRLAGSVLIFFFVFHAGVAAGGVVRPSEAPPNS